MHLHTFKARSLTEALRLVREELGPDASVLHTRDVASGLSRWLGGRMIEVTATAEMSVPSRLPAAIGAGRPSNLESDVSEERRELRTIPRAELQDFRGRIRQGLLATALGEPSLVEQLARAANHDERTKSHRHGSLWQRLISAGVSEKMTERWLERLEAELACDPESHSDRTQERLRHIIAADLPVRGPIRLRAGQPTVVALVGPTGVGKTTTLAKLAAHFHLREQRTVGLITVDTYRVAAIEQLRTYSQIMDLPLEVAASPNAMAAAVQRLSDREIVLIDTSGRSPRDSAGLRELREILAAAQPDEVPLVLSCTGDQGAFEVAAREFRRAGATSLILTKIDEAWRLGQLPDWLAAGRLPLCYTTHGQNVPEDLEPASALGLAELVFPDR